MNKKLTLIIMLALVLLLNACNRVSRAADESETAETSMVEGTPAAEGSVTLDETSRLMAGTMLLEGSDLSLSTSQAGELLPLWKGYRSLQNSETTAAAELNGLLSQIRDEMTPEQIAAIDGMQINFSSLQENLQDIGIEFRPAFGAEPNVNREDMQATFTALEATGQLPEGMGPGGNRPDGEGFPMGEAPPEGLNPEDMNPEQQATMQAMRDNRGGGQGMAPFMLDALIKFLEKKSSG